MATPRTAAAEQRIRSPPTRSTGLDTMMTTDPITFDQLLNALLGYVGKRVDASVFHSRDGVQVLLVTMSGKLRAVRPVDPDTGGTPEEVVYLSLTAADRHDTAAFLVERAMFRGGSIDKDGISLQLGTVELHLSRAPR